MKKLKSSGNIIINPIPECGWWLESRSYIQSVMEEDFDLFCRLLAATSPMSTITTNVIIASRAYRQIKEQGHISDNGYMRVHWVSLGKFLGTIPGTPGRKIWSLYQNLIGNEMVCAIDRWMMRYYGMNTSHLSERQYDRIEKKITREAKALHISPAERQSQIWIASRASGSTRGRESYATVMKELGISKINLTRRLI